MSIKRPDAKDTVTEYIQFEKPLIVRVPPSSFESQISELDNY